MDQERFEQLVKTLDRVRETTKTVTVDKSLVWELIKDYHKLNEDNERMEGILTRGYKLIDAQQLYKDGKNVKVSDRSAA